jgi:hypothetical protein
MDNKKETIGYLFESIAYHNLSDVESFVNNLTPEQSYYVIIQAIEMAYNKNIFSLSESEILSKSIRILNLKRLSNSEK